MSQPPLSPLNDNFVNLLCVACEDPLIHAQLEDLLALPAPSRQAVVQTLVTELRAVPAPAAIIEAVAGLVDDKLAAQARLLIATWKRP